MNRIYLVVDQSELELLGPLSLFYHGYENAPTTLDGKRVLPFRNEESHILYIKSLTDKDFVSYEYAQALELEV